MGIHKSGTCDIYGGADDEGIGEVDITTENFSKTFFRNVEVGCYIFMQEPFRWRSTVFLFTPNSGRPECFSPVTQSGQLAINQARKCCKNHPTGVPMKINLIFTPSPIEDLSLD
jgi:hypothetical protein